MIKNLRHHDGARLFLRLPADNSSPLLWLLASSEDTQYGSVEAGEVDPQLASLLIHYPTWVLVPSTEITFHQIKLPYRSRRQRLQVLPFILEEQLATDIEKLHFAVLQQKGDMCDVAVMEKTVMQGWLAYCDKLGIREQKLLPDVLMLPLASEGWSAVSLNDQWLFRRDTYAGMVVESAWLPQFLAISAPSVIESYSTPPTHSMGVVWRKQPERSVLQLAAEMGKYNGADLRQDEFARKGNVYARIHSWRSVIFSLMVYAVLLCLDAGITHYRLWKQAGYWQQMSADIYLQLFPGEKNVINPRVQMMKHLKKLPADNPLDMGSIVRQLQQLLAETSAVHLKALAWDGRRRELKIDLQAASFQALDEFQQLAGKKYHLQSGEIQQNPEGVESKIILGVVDD